MLLAFIYFLLLVDALEFIAAIKWQLATQDESP